MDCAASEDLYSLNSEIAGQVRLGSEYMGPRSFAREVPNAENCELTQWQLTQWQMVGGKCEAC